MNFEMIYHGGAGGGGPNARGPSHSLGANYNNFGSGDMSSIANLDLELEGSKEDEIYLRNNWKLIAASQFLNIFRGLLKLKDTGVTPYELEQTLLRP